MTLPKLAATKLELHAVAAAAAAAAAVGGQKFCERCQKCCIKRSRASEWAESARLTTEMACNRGLGVMLLLIVAAVAWQQLANASKIAYKKPLYGKLSYTKEKYFKTRSSSSQTTTEPEWPAAVDVPAESSSVRNLQQQEFAADGSSTATTPAHLDSTLASPATTTTAMPAAQLVDQSQLPVPCTCGVFLSSQIKGGQLDVPLISNEMDRMFPCNAIGRKQCQTKCLEVIVQHLPNSANIVCATLGRDCHKERAYLFIKNCHNQWMNTNLQAGREYCCREGTPYRCPLLG